MAQLRAAMIVFLLHNLDDTKRWTSISESSVLLCGLLLEKWLELEARIDAGSPRKQIVCFRGEDVLLVSDGHSTRVYAAEGRFDADLSGRCNVPLTE